MFITILDVTVTTPAGKKYQMAEVAYRNNEGKVESKKIMSFVNKDVFGRVSQAKKGDSFNVTLAKDDAGYWQWTSITEGDSVPKEDVKKVTAGANPTPRSNYETPEERAQRQVYIIRQSSIANAVEFVNGNSKTAEHTVEKVIEVARAFERYVFDQESHEDPTQLLKEMEDDIPM